MDLQDLIDRAEITDVLTQYARGADRSDWALVRACYHPDAHDDHGLYSGGIDGLMVFLEQVAGKLLSTTHQLGNLLIERDGDAARTETYCFVWYRRSDRQGAERSVAQGVRYLDIFERRSGRWAIARRTVVLDWEHVLEPGTPARIAEGWKRGARGSADPTSAHLSLAASSRQPS